MCRWFDSSWHHKYKAILRDGFFYFYPMKKEISASIICDDIEDLHQEIAKISSGKKIFVLTDSTVNELWMDVFLSASDTLNNAEVLVIEPGEESKSLEISAHLWSHLLECQADRHSILINIGGGVVTDIGGFVASTYKRGIPFIQIPTSLLGMVDAAHGGKTGINHDQIKNCIGTFSTPLATLIHTDFLQTLSPKELLSGFAEMLKHALISDGELWNQFMKIETLQVDTIQPWVAASIAIKESIVEEDFYEQNKRKLLNVGHTIGHALESYYLATNQPITHGEAVALGIIIETQLSCDRKLIESEQFSQIHSGISRFYNSAHYNLPSFEDWATYLYQDKKNKDGQLRLSLLTGIGSATYDILVDSGDIKNAYQTILAK